MRQSNPPSAAGDRSFLGTGWGFPPQFDGRDRSVRMVSEDEDIKESLHILFSTSPGERIMNPAFGSELRAHVFDPISDGLRTEIADLVERAILFFEPRITLDSVEVLVNDDGSSAGSRQPNRQRPNPMEGVIEIDVTYTIRSTNTRSNLVFPFYLSEASITEARRNERWTEGTEGR